MAATPTLHVGDTGPFVHTITSSGAAVNLTGATIVKVSYTAPSGTVTSKSGVDVSVTDAAAGEVTVTLETGDIDEAGEWKVQTNYTFSDRNRRTHIATFWVGPDTTA